MDNKELIDIAKEARQNAYAPLSNYHVGAALITKGGKIYKGCNIEDKSSIGVTNCCAERLAIMKAISEGEKEFEKIAVVGGPKDCALQFTTPCGVCRQYMMTLTPNIKVVCADEENEKEYVLKYLLPDAFTEEF